MDVMSAPRTMTYLGLRYLTALAAQKTDGCFLEVGPLFGSSTRAIAAGRKGTDAFHTIDTFKAAPWVKRRFGFDLSRELFNKFTAGIDNLTVHEGYAPTIVEDYWSDKIGFYFDDATHGDPGWTNNFEFFSNYFNDDAIICGDDFAAGWPDIVNNVTRLSEEWDAKLFVMGRVWAMTKSGENRIQAAINDVCPLLKDIHLTVHKGRKRHKSIAACWTNGLHLKEPINGFRIDSKKQLHGQIVTLKKGSVVDVVKHGTGQVKLKDIDQLYLGLMESIGIQFCVMDEAGKTQNTKAYRSTNIFNIPEGSQIVAVRLTQL